MFKNYFNFSLFSDFINNSLSRVCILCMHLVWKCVRRKYQIKIVYKRLRRVWLSFFYCSSVVSNIVSSQGNNRLTKFAIRNGRSESNITERTRCFKNILTHLKAFWVVLKYFYKTLFAPKRLTLTEPGTVSKNFIYVAMNISAYPIMRCWSSSYETAYASLRIWWFSHSFHHQNLNKLIWKITEGIIRVKELWSINIRKKIRFQRIENLLLFHRLRMKKKEMNEDPSIDLKQNEEYIWKTLVMHLASAFCCIPRRWKLINYCIRLVWLNSDRWGEILIIAQNQVITQKRVRIKQKKRQHNEISQTDNISICY